MIMVSLMGVFILNSSSTNSNRAFFLFDQTVEYNSVSFLSLLYISRPVDAKVRDESGWQVYGLRVKSKESKFFTIFRNLILHLINGPMILASNFPLDDPKLNTSPYI